MSERRKVVAAERQAVRHQGEVVEWSDEKRCGFIRLRGAAPEDPLVFVGAFSMASGKMPVLGSTLVFELVQLPPTAKNRRLRTLLRAENATFPGETAPPGPSYETERIMSILGVAYLAALSCIGLYETSTLLIPVSASALSAAAFLSYGLDKWFARRNMWRTSESFLHLLAVAGGWPGAAISQRLWRHKTRKASFRAAFFLTVLLNVAATVIVLVCTWQRSP